MGFGRGSQNRLCFWGAKLVKGIKIGEGKGSFFTVIQPQNAFGSESSSCYKILAFFVFPVPSPIFSLVLWNSNVDEMQIVGGMEEVTRWAIEWKKRRTSNLIY